MQFLHESLVELITQTSTNLPPDVRAAMGIAIANEAPGTQSSQALSIIASNIDMAADDEGPICQDTGMPTFVVHTPVGVNQIASKKADPRGCRRSDQTRQAAAEFGRFADRQEHRRQSGRRNSGDSLRAVGAGRDRGEADPEGRRLREQEHPVFAAHANWIIWAARIATLEGVRKCILHAVWQAQGQGCAPGAVGVCIGSDRAHGYVLAKQELFRTLDDVNPIPELAELEAEIMEEANRLGVGAMGFGGKVVADRMQDRAPPIACPRAISCRSPTIAGRIAGWVCAWMPEVARLRSWLYRDPDASGRRRWRMAKDFR